MCQLCAINTLSSSERWPKPLERHIRDLTLLVDAAHNDCTSKSFIKDQNGMPTAAHLHNILDLSTMIETLSSARHEWWMCDEKKKQRREWEEAGAQAKLVALNKVNNRAAEIIEAVRARLGVHVVWGLGVKGGVEEVEQLVGREVLVGK